VISTTLDRRIGRSTLAVAGVLVGVATLLPVVAVVIAAVRSGTPDSPGASWTLSGLKQVYTTDLIVKPLLDTLKTCVPATAIALVLGVTFAWLVARTDMATRSVLERIILTPVYFSPLAIAVGWITVYAPHTGLLSEILKLDFTNVYSTTTITLFIGVVFAPYVYLVSIGALQNMDAGFEDAGAILGTKAIRRFWSITIPMLRPQLLASSLLVFTQSTAMFAEPLIFGTRFGFTNLPIAIYSQINSYPYNYSLATAISTTMLIISLIGLAIYWRALQQVDRFVSAQGRGFSNRRTNLGKLRWPAAGLMWAYLLVVILLPAAGLLLTSLRPFLSPKFEWSTLGGKQWRTTFDNPVVVHSIYNTVQLAAGVATGAVLIGFLVSYYVVRRPLPFARILDGVSILPIGLPSLVLGVGFVWAYLALPKGVYGTSWSLGLALFTIVIPQAIRTLDAGLRQIGRQPEEAAAILGAGTGRTMLRVAFPMVRSSLLSTWLFVFLLVSIQVSVPLVLRTPGNDVLAVSLWAAVTESGNLPVGCVIALIQGLLSAVVVLVALAVGRNRRLAATL